MAGGRDLELDRPRSAVQLIGLTVDVYFRFPLLFLILAGAVVIPYEVIILLVTGNGPFAQGHDGFIVGQVISLTTIALVGPLLSALHVHAVSEIRDGTVPRLGRVARSGLATLPTVSAAAVIGYLGACAALIALIVPGVLLFLRWSVVAQAAALGDGGWKAALRRSADLTGGHYWHVTALVLMVAVISFIPHFGIGAAFGHRDTTVVAFVVGTVLAVVFWSFGALASGLLFFDLRGRLEREAACAEVEQAALDPEGRGPEGRAPGWYVDPERPRRMRYWAADGTPTWSTRTARTPKKTLAEWKRERS